MQHPGFLLFVGLLPLGAARFSLGAAQDPTIPSVDLFLSAQRGPKLGDIKSYLENIKKTLKKERAGLQKRADEINAGFARCDLHLRGDLEDQVHLAELKLPAAKLAHSECRAHQIVNQDAACKKFNLNGFKQNVSTNRGSLKQCMESSYTATAALKCIAATREWLVLFEDEHRQLESICRTGSPDLNVTDGCGEAQSHFELVSCQWADKFSTACSTYNACRREAQIANLSETTAVNAGVSTMITKLMSSKKAMCHLAILSKALLKKDVNQTHVVVCDDLDVDDLTHVDLTASDLQIVWNHKPVEKLVCNASAAAVKPGVPKWRLHEYASITSIMLKASDTKPCEHPAVVPASDTWKHMHDLLENTLTAMEKHDYNPSSVYFENLLNDMETNHVRVNVTQQNRMGTNAASAALLHLGSKVLRTAEKKGFLHGELLRAAQTKGLM